MNSIPQILAGFKPGLVLNSFLHATQVMHMQGCAWQLLIAELEKRNVGAITSAENLHLTETHISMTVATSDGSYMVRVLHYIAGGERFEVRITELKHHSVLNTFKLSKLQPSGLPDDIAD